MPLTLGTAAWQYSLPYPGRRHPDAIVFRRLELRLRETGREKRMENVNTGHPPIVRTPVNKVAVTVAVKREPWRSSREIARELGLSQPRVLKYFMKVNCIHASARGLHIRFQTIVLYGCNFVKYLRHQRTFYIKFCGRTKHVLRVTACSAPTTGTYGQGIIRVSYYWQT
jgi:hypothetical protein